MAKSNPNDKVPTVKTEQAFIVTTRTILTGIFVIGLLWLFVQLKVIVLSFFFAIILSLALEPLVTWFEKKGLSRGLSVLVTLVLSLGWVAVLTAIALVPMFRQTVQLIENLPGIIKNLVDVPVINIYLQQLQLDFTRDIDLDSTEGTLRLLLGTLSDFGMNALVVVGTILTIILFTVYFLLDLNYIKELLIKIFPPRNRKFVKRVVDDVEVKLGLWLRTEVFLMFLVGFMVYVGLVIIGFFIGEVPYAGSIALIAGLLEIVPIVGPIVATLIAAIIGFSVSPILGVALVMLFIIVQQFEGNFLVPKIIQRVVGFKPIVTVVVIIAGGHLFGVLGALLAVPVTLIVSVVFHHIYSAEENQVV